jgi:hypothetical protein
MTVTRFSIAIRIVVLAFGLAVAGAATAQTVDAYKQKAMKCEAAEKVVKAHLDTFDDLDYNVFTTQQWTELHRSHSPMVLQRGRGER